LTTINLEIERGQTINVRRYFIDVVKRRMCGVHEARPTKEIDPPMG
jgi:hypothetical protein